MKVILIIIFIMISIYCILYIGYYSIPRRGCIFTCTTFFDFKTGDRWERFCKAIDSIQTYHSEKTLAAIDTWLIINEYSSTRTTDWCKKVKERYPWMECIQKEAYEKGQARSMNICLQKIGGYEYWIHWEEAWEVRATFLDDAFEAMNTTDITQIQFTYNNGTVNWLDVDNKRIHCEDRICRIDADPITLNYAYQSVYHRKGDTMAHWPLYSLLPSINRVRDYVFLGRFSEDPALWPIWFEWDYARRWWMNGNKKAVLRDGPVWRPYIHTSTYS